MSMNIELNDVKSQWQDIKEAALPEIENYLESGKYVDSPYVTRFEEAWSWYTFKKHSVMVSNGTDAVTLCLQQGHLTESSFMNLVQVLQNFPPFE